MAPTGKPGADERPFAPRVLALLREKLDELTRNQRVLALYFLQHPEKIGYLSIREMAAAAGVSVATVFRLCTRLGYDGYIELGREVQQGIQYELSTPARFRLGTDPLLTSSPGAMSAFERVIGAELDSLNAMVRTLRSDDVTRCLGWMHEADHVVVVGTMGSTSLAEYLAYAASKVLPSVRLVTAPACSATWYQLKGVGAGSLVMILGFPRYPRSTLEIGGMLRDRGCRIVAITDHYRSPLAEISDIVFPMPISFSTIVDSFAAPVAFVHGLIAEYSERHGDVVRASRLQEFEDYTDKAGIWAKLPRQEARSPAARPAKARTR